MRVDLGRADHAMANLDQAGNIEVSAQQHTGPAAGDGVRFCLSFREADELVFYIEELFAMMKYKRKKWKYSFKGR